MNSPGPVFKKIIVLTISVILIMFLRTVIFLSKIFVNTDLGMCELKVRNFLKNIKRLHCSTVHTMGNLPCNTHN